MIRVSGISGFVRFRGTMLMGTAVLAVVSSCSESTAPEMTTQPSSDGVAVIEFNYPDSIKNPLVAGAASSLAGNRISANLVTPSDVASSVTPGAPTYTVASVPFAPEVAPTVRVPKACDDCVITGVPLGFTFAFYGQSFDKLTIGSNGIVGFGALDAQGNPTNMTDGCCWSRFINLKDANNNIIALGWADWVPVSTNQIKYETRGSAPNRRFILQFTNIGENGGNGHITAQLVLYESTNEIALYTTELSTTVVKRAFTQGIENLAASEAEYIAGRDSAKFSLSNDAVKFTPVAQNKPPVITAPSDLAINTDAGVCSSSSSVSAPAFTDDAPGATIVGVRSDTLPLNAPYPKGATTITWTATDVDGLKSSVTQTVTVSDKEAPKFTAPDNINLRVNVGVSFASVNVGTATITSDNCHDASVSGSRTDAPLVAGYPLGVTTITWTAKDASGNSTTATQTVTVTPNVAPKLILPPNIVVNTDARACVATVASLGAPLVKDDLDGVKLVAERDDKQALSAPYRKGVTIVHWTATDADGASVSADQTVTVKDGEAPALQAVSNISQRQDRGVAYAAVSVSQPAITSDNCGDATVDGARSDNLPLSAVYPVGTTTVTWTAIDKAQNITRVSQAVTIVGNVPPVVKAGADIAVNTDRGVCVSSVAVQTASVTDDIDGWSLAGERSDGQPLNAAFPKGVTTIKWTATDYDYAKSSANQTVTVSDKEKPSIVAPPSLSVPNDRGLASANVSTGSPSVADNCPLVKVDGSRSDGAALASAYPVGITTITWTATDASGNSASAAQTITVRDVEAPVVIVPNNFSVNATSPNGAVVTYSVNATDNVGVVSLVCEPPSGSLVGIGYKDINCAASDAAGNLTRAEFGVEVLGASEQIANLVGYVQSLHLSNGVENPLVNQLRNADKNPNSCQKMDDFIHMVSVKGGSISVAQSWFMVGEARRIKSVLGCAGAA